MQRTPTSPPTTHRTPPHRSTSTHRAPVLTRQAFLESLVRGNSNQSKFKILFFYFSHLHTHGRREAQDLRHAGRPRCKIERSREHHPSCPGTEWAPRLPHSGPALTGAGHSVRTLLMCGDQAAGVLHDIDYTGSRHPAEP